MTVNSGSICAVCFNNAHFEHDIVCSTKFHYDDCYDGVEENITNIKPVIDDIFEDKRAAFINYVDGHTPLFTDINSMSTLKRPHAEIVDFENLLDSVDIQLIRKQCQNCKSIFVMNIVRANPLDEIRFWKKFRENWKEGIEMGYILLRQIEEYEDEHPGKLNLDNFREEYFGKQHIYESYKESASYFIIKSLDISFYRNVFISENKKLCSQLGSDAQRDQLSIFWDRVYECFYEFSSNFLLENYISCTILCRTISDLIFMLYSGDTSKYLTAKNSSKVDHLFSREFVSERDKKMLGQINNFGNRGAHDGGSANREVLFRQITFLRDFLTNMTKYDIIENEYEMPDYVVDRLQKLKWAPIHSFKEIEQNVIET